VYTSDVQEYVAVQNISACGNELIGDWGKLHSVEFCDLYSSQNIIQMIKSRTVRWVGACDMGGRRRGLYWVLVGKPEGERDHLQDIGVDGRIV
jgi:hypothetical protein